MPRAPKKCGQRDCETRVAGRTYCDQHTAELQQRANTTARGYGWSHQQERARAIAAFVPGQRCPRCGRPIHVLDDVDLDHTDDRRSYQGLAHAACNRSTSRPAKR